MEFVMRSDTVRRVKEAETTLEGKCGAPTCEPCFFASKSSDYHCSLSAEGEEKVLRPSVVAESCFGVWTVQALVCRQSDWSPNFYKTDTSKQT